MDVNVDDDLGIFISPFSIRYYNKLDLLHALIRKHILHHVVSITSDDVYYTDGIYGCLICDVYPDFYFLTVDYITVLVMDGGLLMVELLINTVKRVIVANYVKVVCYRVYIID